MRQRERVGQRCSGSARGHSVAGMQSSKKMSCQLLSSARKRNQTEGRYTECICQASYESLNGVQSPSPQLSIDLCDESGSGTDPLTWMGREASPTYVSDDSRDEALGNASTLPAMTMHRMHLPEQRQGPSDGIQAQSNQASIDSRDDARSMTRSIMSLVMRHR